MPLPKVEENSGNFTGCDDPLPGIYGKLPFPDQPHSIGIHRLLPRCYATIIKQDQKKYPLISFLPNGKRPHFYKMQFCFVN
jgi:hypothetical protein